MGAAWRSPKDRDIPKVAAMIAGVKALGLETCATLGMLSGEQARALKDAGLDYYNHNLDTAPDYYDSIIHTRQYQDRLDTLEHVRDAGLKTCCGGIVGMGETRAQRVGLLLALASLPAHPDSVPINKLVQVAGALRDAQGRRRPRRTVTRRDGVRLEVDGQWLTGFCSNDYLGLAQQFSVVNALQDAAAREGAGAGASHLVCGHHALHEALEREVAEWLGYPRALLFGSGFAANLAVQQALLSEENDVCVQDKLNHASLLDATRLAGARLRRYPHLDAEGAMRQLKHAPDGAAMLATDGVFSMDGDIAPLRALSLVARLQQALFYVDDAHGVGVVGDGRGAVAAAGLGVDDVPLQLVTLGKALGGSGALVLGRDDLIEHLAETARPYIYTTAVPPAMAAAALEAVRLARRDNWRRSN